MTTFYLDLVGGNDSNDGLSFANRWKTFASGATAARIAPGDTIRVMGSATPTSLSQNVAWTQNSKTVTLASALTLAITDCESAWTASANVTATANSSDFKSGTKSANLAIASAFTTGLAAYFATGTLDLSGYKQISFWFQGSASVADGATLSLRLCSDTAGVTTVNTIAIPAYPNSGQWAAITIDTGGALGASIQSIALYCDKDPGTITVKLDNIQACKDSTSADSLSLSSLLGKICNLSWVASTTYATNDRCRPTQPNRNGFQYKVTAGGGGSSGGSEPTWPTTVGATVTDGALTWTCDSLEDTWYGIQSINGTTVLLDNDVISLANQGRGYADRTETIATYKRECIVLGMASSSSTAINAVQDSGTPGNNIIFSGGWDRTNMSTQTEETWCDGRNGAGNIYDANSNTNIAFFNLNACRGNLCLNINGSNAVTIATNCHAANMSGTAFQLNGSGQQVTLKNIMSVNGASNPLTFSVSGRTDGYRLRAESSRSSDGISVGTQHNFNLVEVYARNNNGYGYVGVNSSQRQKLTNLTTGNNSSGAINQATGALQLLNALLPEGTVFAAQTAWANYSIFSQKHQQTADSHLITTDGGTIISATDQRHTASGISWKFRPTSTNRSAGYPLRLSIAKVACAANVLVTNSIWTRRDNTNIKGQLVVLGGQLAGVGDTVAVDCQPSINTWVQSSNLTFTPTEAGVIEVLFLVWDGVGTSNNFWIDDFVTA